MRQGMWWPLENIKCKKVDPLLESPEKNTILLTLSSQLTEMYVRLLT